MRRLPTCRSVTSPACLSTFRCWETAGRLTGSSPAIAPTEAGPSPSRSKTARRVGSPSAVMGSALASTYGKATLTDVPSSRALVLVAAGPDREHRVLGIAEHGDRARRHLHRAGEHAAAERLRLAERPLDVLVAEVGHP